MVPHGTVEEAVVRTLGLGGGDDQPVAVVGVPDESKGEALVLLSTEQIASDALREKLERQLKVEVELSRVEGAIVGIPHYSVVESRAHQLGR